MSKKEFLSKLHNSLFWRFNNRETAEILSDYIEQFQAGEEEGRTEAELCMQFGTPKRIVKEMLEKKKPNRKVILCIGALLLIIYLVVFFFQTRDPKGYYEIISEFLFFNIVTTSILWFLFGGRYDTLPYIDEREAKKHRKISLMIYCVLFAFVFIAYYLFIDLLLMMQRNDYNSIFGNMKSEEIGPYCYGWIMFVFTLLCISIFYMIVSFIKKSIFIFPYISLLFGLFLSLLCIEMVLKTLDDPMISISSIIVPSLAPMILSIVIALFFSFMIRRLKIKEANNG